MNQILVTKKLYITPELKKKKKAYKAYFFLSVFLICILISVYIYAEYDRNKEESISKTILSQLDVENDEKIDSKENPLIVLITREETKVAAANNEEERNVTATSTYTASNGKKYDYIGIVSIPKINISYPILSECSIQLLKVSTCRFHGGNPNEVGNLCIVGHNYRRKGVFFSDVPDLDIGDIVEVTDLSKKTVQYEIYDIHTVIPDNVDDTTQKTNGRREVTLITCTDDSSQRVIVKCREKV